MKRLVVLSGAGMSAESGIATFRGAEGLWEGHRVEDVATPEAWAKDPHLVLEFYNQRRAGVMDAKPNRGHEILAELESDFDVRIITQNVDDLHERAGSTKVMHLHGELMKARSERYVEDIFDWPHRELNWGEKCPKGTQLRPHIVWFGEAVPMIEPAAALCQIADVFLVIGTSLNVYPAAGLLDFVLPHVPVYLIDPQIPPVKIRPNFTPIAAGASEGMSILKERLLQN